VERFGMPRMVEAVGKVTYPAIDLQAVCWRVRQQRYLHRLSPSPKTSTPHGDLRSTEDFRPPPTDRGTLPNASIILTRDRGV
jgi:hypothetical protein